MQHEHTLNAINVMLQLAEENAIRLEELTSDGEPCAEFEEQQHALEVVQDYIDSDLGATMTRYTTDEIKDALVRVAAMGKDNILDESECNSDDKMIENRRLCLYAENIMMRHIYDHFET